jgi:hypothetical protein
MGADIVHGIIALFDRSKHADECLDNALFGLANMVTGLSRGTKRPAGGIRMLGMVAEIRRRQFGFVAAYLVVLFSVIIFVFHFR